MIAALALRFAGPDALLVSRPTGVLHVYVGPLTRSGRSVPRSSRPVCRAHTRRLTVVLVDGDPTASHKRVCARCAVCLSKGKARQAAHLTSRAAYKTRFAGITGRDLVTALADARTPVEVDQVAHLTLLLFDHTGCRRPDPATGRSLHQHVTRARARFQTEPLLGHDWEARGAAARARRAADWQAEQEGREARIARIGISNALP